MSDKPSPARGSASHPWSVLIVGAGFGGLGMAIALGRAGEQDRKSVV